MKATTTPGTSLYRGCAVTVTPNASRYAWQQYLAEWSGINAGSVYGATALQARSRAHRLIDRRLDGPAWQDAKAYAYVNR